MSNMSSVPWVEKYRPKEFEKIVLEEINRKILDSILKTNTFPNLLIYGPPGTGKTTTIINLINRYQEINKTPTKGLVIHLNASDERGIDIIRNQIAQFVSSKPLFTKDKMSSMLQKNEHDILHKLKDGQKLTNAEIARTIFTASALTNDNNDEWVSTLLKATEKLLMMSESSELAPILSSEFLQLPAQAFDPFDPIPQV